MTEVSLSGSQTKADMQKSKWIAVDDMDPGEQERRQKNQKYMDDDTPKNLYALERMRLRTFLVDLNPEGLPGEDVLTNTTTEFTSLASDFVAA